MMSWKQLEQLERFDSAGARVLSLALNLNPTRQATRSYRMAVKSLVQEVSATLTEAERRDLAREVQRVTESFDQRETPGARADSLLLPPVPAHRATCG
jgi:hypothetical protein